MPHKPADLQKHVEAAAPADVDLRFKAMFGGISGYADGRIFLSLSDVGLALKLGEADRAALLKVKGAKPLQYEPSMPPSKTYVVVPDTMLSDRKALNGWISRSCAFVKSQPAKPAKKAKKSRS